jgi:hypothetical protein
MPSIKNPFLVVLPGPGKVPANAVPASALSFPIAGGSGDITAHVNDPTDAHFAGAIGVPETYPPTGDPLLSSVGGPFEGESLLDVIYQLKDLIPVAPDRIGYNAAGVPNSGVPSWGAAFNPAIRGGWTTTGGLGRVSKYLLPAASATTSALSGVVYPADRGVLALYHTTNEATDFFAGGITLLAALWLGQNPAPAGIPSAAFDPLLRANPAGQSDYVPAGTGIDQISLVDRLPYLSNYPGAEYAPYGSTFPTFQIAKYSASVVVTSGPSGSYLLVHWQPQFATSLAAIQTPTVGNLIAANCYSAVPADTANFDTVNRAQVFVDTSSGTGIGAGPLPSSTPAGTTTTIKFSGVDHYNSTGLQFTVNAIANNLFANAYLTNASASASVPAGFESTPTPCALDLTEFGGPVTSYALYDQGGASKILNNATNNPFTLAAPPATNAVAMLAVTQPVGGSAVPFAGGAPGGRVKVIWSPAFAAPTTQTETQRYLYDSVGNAGSSSTTEAFTDEQFRYVASFVGSSVTTPLLPAGADDYNSTTVLASNTAELQIVAGRLVYPGTNFSSGFSPAGPNYATVRSADAANLKRRYIRAFDTGIPRNTGKLQLVGLSFSSFDAGVAAIDATEVADHPGGAIVQIKVPGATGWLDLGRASGLPDVDKTQNFRGCRVGIASDVYTYETAAFTANNGSGQFVLLVRITFLKNGTGENLSLDAITWLPP